MINKSKGITLIALVVTVIVLIILATVSINMVVGENGIIKKAEQARDAYEESSKKEVEGLNSMLEEMMKATGKGPNSKPLVDTLTDIQTSTVDAEDVYGKEVTVPKGFKVKPEYGTKVNDGIVIEDDKGNQFVWVPCTEKQYKKHEYNTKTVDDRPVGSYINDGNGWTTRLYRYYTDWTDDGGDKDSVIKNGGFYVGRYEAGVPDNAPFSVNNESNKNSMIYYTNTDTNGNSKNTNKYKPVSKQGMQAWNYISQTNAVEVSKNMYSGAESSYGVTSQLIDGIAWDRTVEWITSEEGITDSRKYGNYKDNTTQLTENVLYAQHIVALVKEEQSSVVVIANKYKKGNPKLGEETLTDTEERLKYNSADYINGQNYSTSTHTLSKYIELSTGAVSEFKLKNIYDMAGNMYEWTTETGHLSTTGITTGTKYSVRRGGCWFDPGSFDDSNYIVTIFSRFGGNPVDSFNVDIGFRVVLYIK